MRDKTKILMLSVVIAVAVTVLESASVADLQSKSRLVILPHAYESNKIRAALDEAFSLSCITESDQAAANSLRWYSPQNEPIELLTSTSLDNSVRRVYTVLKKNQLSITFEKLVPQDAGIYTCRALQDSQEVEVKVELVLEKKISFFETPLSQFIRGGQDQLVVCKATSIPGPEITWFRKGIFIELKNDQKYQITNDGLIIKNAQPEDEGVYYCKATVTATGEVKRAEIDVQVMSEPRWVIKPEDTDGVMDQDVVIRCEAFGKPAPAYKWLRDGIQLVGSRYQQTGNTLRIVGLTRHDAGTYTCWAENTSGWKDAVFHLNVLVGPVVPLIEDVRVVEGNKAVLRCVVKEAFPKATIRWRITDQVEFIDPAVNPEYKIVDDSLPDQQTSMSVKVSPLEGNTIGSWSELIIERATRAHRRNFTCVASNKAAVTERQMQLFVDYKPTLLINLESREIYYSWIFTDGFGNSGSDSSLPSRSYPVVLTCLADGEPRPQITWYHKTLPIHHDNVKYRLLRDEPGLSRLEVTPKSIEDFGDYMCNAENRHGFEQRNLQLRLATPPKMPPYFLLKTIHPDMVTFDIKPSDAPDADGGMPIESYRIGWRFLTADWTEEYEKEFQIDPNAIHVLAERNYNMDNVEVTGLLPDTEYLFRVCAVNKPGRGAWSTKEMKVKTAPRRQPDPVRVTSREDCQASTRCFIEWVVDSSGGSPVRDFLIRFRRISYKDSTYQHVNTEKIEPWSATAILKAPSTSYELINLLPDSFYEVEILARNDIGPSASQPFRVRTLPGQLGEAEEYRRRDIFKINRVVIISGLIIGALILYLILDLVLLMNSNRGLLAYISRSCSKNGKGKSASIEYKNKTSQTKIAQHGPPKTTANGSKTPYQPIKQVDETNNVTVS